MRQAVGDARLEPNLIARGGGEGGKQRFCGGEHTHPAILWLHSSQMYRGGGLSPRATDSVGSIHICKSNTAIIRKCVRIC